MLAPPSGSPSPLVAESGVPSGVSPLRPDLAGGRPDAAGARPAPANWMGSTRNAVPGYDIPAVQVTRHRLLDMPIRTSSLRSLGAHLNVFAIESFIDELAAAAGADPVAFRLAHLTDPRARQVLTEAAHMAGWATRARRDGIGYGAGGGPLQGKRGVLRRRGRGGGRHRYPGAQAVARGGRGPGHQSGRGDQPGRGRRRAERELDAARAGPVRPGEDHVGELGQLSDPPVHRGS